MMKLEMTMPRPINMTDVGQAKAARQAQYRIKLRQRREPEADRVDTALSQALVAFMSYVSEERLEAHKTVVQMLLRATLDLLIDAGYDADAAKKVLHRRVSSLSRPDIAEFIRVGRLDKRIKTAH